jgi:hypothetical protein
MNRPENTGEQQAGRFQKGKSGNPSGAREEREIVPPWQPKPCLTVKRRH